MFALCRKFVFRLAPAQFCFQNLPDRLPPPLNKKMEWAVLYPKHILSSLTLLGQWIGCGYELLAIFHYPLSWAKLSALRRKRARCPVLTWNKNVFWAKAIEWITVLNIWNKRHEKVLCMFISWWKILIKLLQWPCNEPLNALRATPTRKRNCLHRKSSPPPSPVRKKINHLVRKWRRKDCVALTRPRFTSCA